MARQKATYESKVEKAKQKIHDNPRVALTYIGQFLVKELRQAAPKSKKKRWVTKKNGTRVLVRPGGLKKYIQYWVRKREGDLQVGAKSFYAPMIEMGSSTNAKNPFMLNTVLQNTGVIQSMIADALKELTKD